VYVCVCVFVDVCTYFSALLWTVACTLDTMWKHTHTHTHT